jgi:flagellar basal body-associated protein FliL
MTRVLIVGLIAGAIVGIWPLIAGIRAEQRNLGISGFFATLLGGAVFGLLLAVPIAVFFAWFIAKKSSSEPKIESEPQAVEDSSDQT